MEAAVNGSPCKYCGVFIPAGEGHQCPSAAGWTAQQQTGMGNLNGPGYICGFCHKHVHWGESHTCQAGQDCLGAKQEETQRKDAEWSWQNGIICRRCGQFYLRGYLHYCEDKAKYGNEDIRPTVSHKTPHKCPVCEGRGKLQYNPENPFTNFAVNTLPVWKCHACKGEGVLWG